MLIHSYIIMMSYFTIFASFTTHEAGSERKHKPILYNKKYNNKVSRIILICFKSHIHTYTQ